VAVEKQAPVFGRPKDWDKMTPEQKREWAMDLVRAATGKAEEKRATASGPSSLVSRAPNSPPDHPFRLYRRSRVLGSRPTSARTTSHRRAEALRVGQASVVGAGAA
jgi:hypothetical protein